MCGLVAAISERNVISLLLESLKLLEYRGYDAATMSIINSAHKIERRETLNKVIELEKLLKSAPLLGKTGIANTYWSRGNKKNTNSRTIDNDIEVIQNGFIENNEKLRNRLLAVSPSLNANTDTELTAYLVSHYIKLGQSTLTAMRSAEKEIEGTFAACLLYGLEPDHLKVLHRGSTLVIGLGINENFIASDYNALLHVSERFVYLEEGDIADITSNSIAIYDKNDVQVERQIYKVDSNGEIAKKGKYSHFMQKEIDEQPDVILATLQGRLNDQQVFVEAFGQNAPDFFCRIHRVQIVATGSSFHAALVAQYWFESISGLPCRVELAGEYRYRERMVESNTLFVTLSQSGETIETVNALHIANNLGYTATLTIGNAPESSLVNESDLVLITGAGTGINMTSTKDFTAQLAALSLLALALGRYHRLDQEKEAILAKKLINLPIKARQTLTLDPVIQDISKELCEQQRALYIGNGIYLPVAMEGAMKLKETSSIITEAYLADEFNQDVSDDQNTSIVALAPPGEDDFLSQVRNRNSKVILFADKDYKIQSTNGLRVINLPSIDKWLAPMIYVIPMQLLAYHVAILKGSDVDKPRQISRLRTIL